MVKKIIFTTLLLSLFLISNFSVFGVSESNENNIYPMYGINEQHNFQSEFSAKDNDGYLSKKVEYHFDQYGGPLIVGRYVYLVAGGISTHKWLVKYDIKTGNIVWDTLKSFRFACTHGPSLILWNKTLYFYISDVGDYTYTGSVNDLEGCTQTLWAVSTKDGKVLWKYNAIKVLGMHYHKSLTYAGDWGNLPVVAKDGTIYLSVAGKHNNTTYNAIIAVNPNGTTKWIFPLENGSIGSQELTLDEQGNIYRLTGGTEYYIQSPAYLYSVSPNGTLRWKVRINLKEYSGAAIYRNRIYFVGLVSNSTQWKLFAYNTDGKFLWAYKTDDLDKLFYDPGIYTPTIAPNGAIYLTNGTWIYSISPNGTLNWKLKIPGVYFIVTDRNSYIYFSTAKNVFDARERYKPQYIYLVSPDGKAKILYKTTSPTSVIGSRIYIGSNGEIYCIYYNEDYTAVYLYIFDNNPFAFLENPIFITAVVVIIAIPATYFTVRGKLNSLRNMKKER